jgi:predicted SprT family Zn-dependent metalloprotease
MPIDKEESTVDIMQAMQLCNDLLKVHKLNDWSTIWGQRRNVYGRCRYKYKVIELMQPYVEQAPDEEVINTIRHEIAHALVWTKFGVTGHNDVFYQMCQRIGAIPERCSSFQMTKKYRVTCNACGCRMQQYHRRVDITGHHCAKCGSTDIELEYQSTR